MANHTLLSMEQGRLLTWEGTDISLSLIVTFDCLLVCFVRYLLSEPVSWHCGIGTSENKKWLKVDHNVKSSYRTPTKKPYIVNIDPEQI